MKIAVVGGAGAMGAVWASRLRQAGNDVVIVDVAKPALAAIGGDGLIVEDKAGERHVFRIAATNDPETIGRQDLVIFFVKAQHTAAAADLARPLVDDATTVLTLQNGWGNADVLAQRFPPTQIVMGVTYHSAKALAPGVVAHTADSGPTFVGPYLAGAPLDRAQAIGAAMTAAGIATTVTDQAMTEVWKKLVLNCATLPVAALTRLYSGTTGRTEPLLQVCDALATEAVAVARAKGLPLDPAERTATIRGALAKAGHGKASMLQDVEAQRKTEIEAVNGAIVREAEALGLDAPLNRAMVALVNGLEASWRQ
ncbi:MAG TPA: 2-dehydropantoate 2-reductase [Thermomicrobiales bacterium]|jgi:2-dehydropantoate 2-reductase|nr:2-dehydropantoate 2-reductase [Thermomicrobiales bacterium]